MVETRPTLIPGRWRVGYALDWHTRSSTFAGYDEYGHATYDTVRSEVGELLYRLKYGGDESLMGELVQTASAFLGSWKPPVDLVVPVPASRSRAHQPVAALADLLSKELGLLFAPAAVQRTREVPELKNIFVYDDRTRLLAGVHAIDKDQVAGKGVLLFDDLFRSGATMNSITGALYDQGGVTDVYALTVTRTRSKQ